MITYETDGERLADTTACAGIRADLKMCLLESECCRIVGHCKFVSNISLTFISTV